MNRALVVRQSSGSFPWFAVDPRVTVEADPYHALWLPMGTEQRDALAAIGRSSDGLVRFFARKRDVVAALTAKGIEVTLRVDSARITSTPQAD